MSLVPLNQVCEFDGHTYDEDFALADADSTPTYAVFQEGIGTAIQTGNMTKRSTGTYYVAPTASVANGYTVGKMHQVKMLATVGGAAGAQVLARFVVINALQSGRLDSYVGALASGVIAAATFASNALDAVWSTATRTLTAASDSSGVTTLLSRLSTTRAGYLDNLSAGAVALEASLQGLITTIGASAAGVATAVWGAASRTLSAAGVQAIWDALTSALTTSGSIGKWIVDKLDVVLSTRLATSGYTTPPTAVAIRQEIDNNSTQFAAIVAAVAALNNISQAQVLTQINAALDTTLSATIPVDGTRPTLRQAVYMSTQFLLERTVSGTTLTIKNPDGSTLMTLTLGDATSPTSVTRTT